METEAITSRIGLKSLVPQIVILLLLVLTFCVIAVSVDVNVSYEAGIVMELPDRAGNWVGDEIRYCANRLCGKEWRRSELEDDADVCPECGSRLQGMSIPEADILPDDTEMLKKEYLHSNGERVFVSIVLSGRDRTSIHRPQACLAGQGNSFEHERVISVPLPGRPDLDVMVLDITTAYKRPNQQDHRYHRYYAYWFVGKGRETPYNGQRMFWMGLDRVIRNMAHRWAYISISGVRDPEQPEKQQQQIRDVLTLIYPFLARPTSSSTGTGIAESRVKFP